jgi:hypothetical protein
MIPLITEASLVDIYGELFEARSIAVELGIAVARQSTKDRVKGSDLPPRRPQ